MICDDCINRSICMFDANVERTSCGFYVSGIVQEIIAIEDFIKLLQNYVAEKRRIEKNGNLDCGVCTDGGADRDAGAGVSEAGGSGRA